MKTAFKVGDKFTGKPFTINGIDHLETVTITEIKGSIISDRIRIIFTHKNVANTCSNGMWSEMFEEFISDFVKVS